MSGGTATPLRRGRSTAVVAIEVDEPLESGGLPGTGDPPCGGVLRQVGRREIEWVTTATAGVAHLGGQVEALLDHIETRARTRARAGMALHPLHGDEIAQVRRRAWEACERSRRSGRAVTLWESPPTPSAPGTGDGRGGGPDLGARSALVQPLRTPTDRTLRGGRIQVVDTAARSARLRWPTAVAGHLAVWRAAGGAVPLWCRVDAAGFDHRTAGEVDDLLVSVGAPPSALVFELSDRQPTPWGEIRGAIGEVRAAGVRVVLGDVGAGHTTWARLRQVPVDGLVVDKALLRRDGRHRGDRLFLAAVAELAGDLPLGVGAAGAASAAAAALVAELGYDFVHGSWAGRPGPVDGILA